MYLNGNTLVDGYKVNEIIYTQKETYTNICDMKGLYELTWADGTDFPEHNRNLGGKLQSLFEMRDGNNSVTLEGKISTVTGATDTPPNTIKIVRSDKDAAANFINESALLNIPSHDGEIVINGENERVVFLEGGKGGLGNMHYATSTMQAPKYASS